MIGHLRWFFGPPVRAVLVVVVGLVVLLPLSFVTATVPALFLPCFIVYTHLLERLWRNRSHVLAALRIAGGAPGHHRNDSGHDGHQGEAVQVDGPGAPRRPSTTGSLVRSSQSRIQEPGALTESAESEASPLVVKIVDVTDGSTSFT